MQKKRLGAKAALAGHKRRLAAVIKAEEALQTFEREALRALAPGAVALVIDGEHQYDDGGGMFFDVEQVRLVFEGGDKMNIPNLDDFPYWIEMTDGLPEDVLEAEDANVCEERALEHVGRSRGWSSAEMRVICWIAFEIARRKSESTRVGLSDS